MLWETCPRDPELRDALASGLDLSPVLASLLVNRGVRSPAEARSFLHPDLDDLLDPSLMKDMDRAVARIERAMRRREKVLVYGDYDADGITSTALLLRFFRFLGMETASYIPSRLREGYSLNLAAVRRIVEGGASLVVSVDNGTGSLAEIAELRRQGVDVIVTDHHEPGPELPDAFAIVNPRRPDCPYPFKYLAGVGVAFKLVLALSRRLRPERRASDEFQGLVLEALALVSMGTVADVVPLIGENRILAAHGLRGLPHVDRPGLRSLVRLTRLEGREVGPLDIAFKIGPRLNAAGRMDKVGLALELLTTDSPATADALGGRLEEENTRRQEIERAILEECRERIRTTPSLVEGQTLVLAAEGWHAGVIGIVAAKLADEFHLPTVLVAIRDGRGRGSARSIQGFNILEAIRGCADHLGGFGGHEHAAGLELASDRIGEFAEGLEASARRIAGEGFPPPSLRVDLPIELAEVGKALLGEIGRLAPHGERNPEPVFAARGARVAGPPRAMGRGGHHLGLVVRQGGASLRAVGFRMGAWRDRLRDGCEVDVAFTPRANRWNGRDEVEIHLRDIRMSR